MPLRNLKPITYRAKGLSDAIDGTNAFPGAMSSLANLVQAPSTEDLWVPRAASEEVTTFGSFITPGVVSAEAIIGTRAYGMIASARFAGHDEPFCYDLVNNVFIAISGVTSANTPLTQPTTGDWVPPVVVSPTNSYVLFAHPGFGGGVGPYFGWLDISGFSTGALLGNTTSGSNVITSINDGDLSLPIADGVQPGQTISGAGIPADTTIVSVANGTFSLDTTGDTHGNTTLDSLGSIVGVQVGMLVTGPQFAAGTYVAALPGGSAVTLSTAALGSASGTAVDFTGGGSITISANATASANSVALTIAGGSPAAPLWAAGNTNTNPLVAVPITIGGFNERAYFGVLNGTPWSDIGQPLQRTNADQALTLGDSTPVTALAPLGLSNQVTGGIVQALVAFKGAEAFWQITGDAALNTLQPNLVAGSVGTLAPNTLDNTPFGLAFVAPDGVRILSFAGTVTDPIGAYGKGVSVPFINASFPSRMCAAYGQNTYRISVQNSQIQGQPWQEFCLNMEQKTWSGPHSFPASLIRSYIGGGQNGFILAPQGVPASLWYHTLVPQNASGYTENGMPLAWNWQTVLLPDNEQLSMNAMVKTAAAMLLVAGQVVSFVIFDEASNTLGMVSVTSTQVSGTAVWGSSTWGAFTWGGLSGYLKQYRLPWPERLVFKQARVSASGASAASFAIGNLYLGIQPLGYLIEDWSLPVIPPPPAPPFILDQSQLDGPDVLQ